MCFAKLVEKAAAFAPQISKPGVGYSLSGAFGATSVLASDAVTHAASLPPHTHLVAEVVFLWVARVGIIFATFGAALTFLIQLHNWRKIRREQRKK